MHNPPSEQPSTVTFSGHWNYPGDLPVVAHRDEILAAIGAHQVVVVVSDTGSGKTTQLPKMVAEALGENPGRIGCTQPRRLAASSVAKRVAEELSVPLGGWVGYQVRFEDRTSQDTRIKFMTDGILLAETQGDRQLRQYQAIILDEAHERSLNIDFLLGYLKRLLEKRGDLKLIISSATLDAGGFAAFFAREGHEVPIIQAPGKLFPVAEFFLAPSDDEELPQHVARAVDHLSTLDPMGDVLVFLPGEREIRECAEVLDGRSFRSTEVLPLYARLSMQDQQRVFQPGNKRRIILATNVAETSLTIPRIAAVIDSGLARVNRWSPGKGVQRLQIEPISQASARQRMGRCGRVRDGICIRLYDEVTLAEQPPFSDPEIRRSSLAGVILRMKSLALPDIEEFPLLDSPAPKAIAEGYRTLREIDALDAHKNLTKAGSDMAKIPVDPRLAKMLLAARENNCLTEAIVLVAGLESNDPRERPAEKAQEADAAQARWKDVESDFMSLLRLWVDLSEFDEGRGRWRRNALRKFSLRHFINARRVLEWSGIAEELCGLLESLWKIRIPPLRKIQLDSGLPDVLHRSLLAGVPRQFALWDPQAKIYRSASGGSFSIFPGSCLFGRAKRPMWVLAMELVETSRLWARKVASIDPAWIEQVAPHLCRKLYGEVRWDADQGAVYANESVICGGLIVVSGRRVHYGRIDAKAARGVFIREGLLTGAVRQKLKFVTEMKELREQMTAIETKLRRPAGLWSDEALIDWLEARIPDSVHTTAAFEKWCLEQGDAFSLQLHHVVAEDLDDLGLERFPDEIMHEGENYSIYYHVGQGDRDDGVCYGVWVDQLPRFPDWLLEWGIDGNLADRVESLIRGLPKDFRRACQPVAQTVDSFVELWSLAPKDRPLKQALCEHLEARCGVKIPLDAIDFSRLPAAMRSKIWVCDDAGEEMAFGEDVTQVKMQLAACMKERFEAVANEEVARSGLTSWDGEALPCSIATPGGLAFPSLTDEGNAVGIVASTSLAESTELHRAGGARLLCLAAPQQIQHLTKKFPLGMNARIGLSHLGQGGTTIDDLLLLTAEVLAAGPFPRAPQDFHQLSAARRGNWHDAAGKVGACLDAIVEQRTTIEAWLSKQRSDRNLTEICEDLDEQWQWLFRSRFIWRAGTIECFEYPRRLRAISSRIGRIQSLPLIKDLEKTQRLRVLWQPWFSRWIDQPEDPALWHIGWLLEEYRVSLFAPDIPLRSKISEKIIKSALETLVR